MGKEWGLSYVSTHPASGTAGSPATLDSRKENVKVEHMMGRTPQLYIVLGYNDYDMKSHQWYITPDLNEAKEIQSRWEKLRLTCQIRPVGDRIDNPLGEGEGIVRL